MKTKGNIVQIAMEKYPFVDVLPRQLGYDENNLAEHKQEAFIDGYNLSDQNTKPLVDEITTLEAKLKDAESVNEVLKTVIDSVCSIVDKKNYEEDSQLHDIYKIVNKSTN